MYLNTFEYLQRYSQLSLQSYFVMMGKLEFAKIVGAWITHEIEIYYVELIYQYLFYKALKVRFEINVPHILSSWIKQFKNTA